MKVISSLCIFILICIFIIWILCIVGAITLVSYIINSKKNINNIYLHKFSDSNFDIDDSLKYLKLTNGIKENKNV